MPHFAKIEPKKVETIHIEYGERAFDIPLAGSLPTTVLCKLGDADGLYNFIKQYIGDDSDIPSDDMAQIIDAWRTESENAKNGGAPLPK